MLLEFAGPILILVYLLLTVLISAYEKLFAWNKTLRDYVKMYKEHLPTWMVKVSLIVVLGLEVIISSILLLGIYDIVTEEKMVLAEVGLSLTGVLFLILLIGLRILQDYRGAGRTAIYFLLTVFGLFWLQSI